MKLNYVIIFILGIVLCFVILKTAETAPAPTGLVLVGPQEITLTNAPDIRRQIIEQVLAVVS